MKMKIVVRKIFIILTIALIFISQLNVVYADDKEIQQETGIEDKKPESNWGEFFNYADNFMENAQKTSKRDKDNVTRYISVEKIRKSSGDIYNILLAVGTALTVVIGGILGIKFMFASVEQKAQIKEMIIPYVIGCIVIYGGFIIWKLVVDILDAM